MYRIKPDEPEILNGENVMNREKKLSILIDLFVDESIDVKVVGKEGSTFNTVAALGAIEYAKGIIWANSKTENREASQGE